MAAASMDIQNVDIGLIYRPSGSRPIDKGRVEDLVRSIKEIGLINPIIVKRAKHYRGADQIDAFDVVAGNHRYEAALELKWHELPCKIIDVDALHMELVEIDENLIRYNLTPAQEAAAVSRRKAIYEELHPETKNGGDRISEKTRTDQNEKSAFCSETAKATGKSRRRVEIAAARGAALGDDLSDIAGTSLDKGVELDALVKTSGQERKSLIERAKAGENVSARRQHSPAPRPSSDCCAREKRITQLIAALKACSPDERDEAYARIIAQEEARSAQRANKPEAA